MHSMATGKAIFTLLASIIAICGLRAEVPILGDARTVPVRPAIFILEDHNGASDRVVEWIKLVRDQYYSDAISAVKHELTARAMKGYTSLQTESVLKSIEDDATHAVIPRWAENIFIVCRGPEVVVSFYARSGGWSKASNGSLVALQSPAYVCIIDPKANVILKSSDSLKAVVFADLYSEMEKGGIATDYSRNSGLVAPLNDTKVQTYPK